MTRTTPIRWFTALSCMLPLALAGCDSDPDQLAGPAPLLDVSGVWDFADTLIISRQVTVCRSAGSFRFEQTGSRFTGRGGRSGTCTGLIGSYPSDFMFDIVDGEIEDSTISFMMESVCGCGSGECRDAYFEGTVTADGRIYGRSACSINLDGSWVAGPAEPLASMEFAADSISMVVGEAIVVEPIMFNESGVRVFERPIEWSSTGSGALEINDSSLVAFQFGFETVTGEVEGLTDELAVDVRHVEFTAVEAGLYHTCGLDQQGAVFCWGVNDRGQAGPGSGLDRCPGLPCRMAPSLVPASVDFVSVRPGFQNTCALTADGSVYCWGINDGGQLGIDTTTPWSPLPVAVSGGHTFASLDVGTSHACGITTVGFTFCWGFNNRTQLGSDVVDLSPDPLPVTAGLTFASVITGFEHSCGLDLSGVTYCWGWNFWGQLGIDSLPVAATPQPVTGGLVFASVVSGMEHSCGLTAGGQAHCWGKSREYQLGYDPGPLNFHITPVPVSGGLTFTALAAGWEHSCGLTSDGSAYCWGRGSEGQLGNGSTLPRRESPVPVLGGLKFQTISAGYYHTCGLATSGLAYCWGDNTSGKLGTGTWHTDVPTKVLGQPN